MSSSFLRGLVCFALILTVVAGGCKKPKEKIVLRRIKDIVVDATSSPLLKANAVFFNPNDLRGRLKRINVDIFVDGKKAASVNQQLKTLIPANAEFSVPIEVNLSIKELGFMDTLLGVIGGKKFEVRYEGSLKLSYHGVPINVPVSYRDEVRIRLKQRRRRGYSRGFHAEQACGETNSYRHNDSNNQ